MPAVILAAQELGKGRALAFTPDTTYWWSGFKGNFSVNDGGRYNAAANRWTATTTIGAPAGRSDHTAV